MDGDKIRNFCIIAHVDHGKSTVSDRILQLTNAVDTKKAGDRVLDSLSVEKSRGITVKSAAMTLVYDHPTKGPYLLNFIDTPGHVDFQYEVSRSLKACQGAVLLVDVLQGIQAQTMSNFYQAFCHGLAILPALNKIDMVVARETVEEVKAQMAGQLDDGWEQEHILEISGKTGLGCDTLLEEIIERIPASVSDEHELSLKALLFDMFYHPVKGVVLLCAIKDGVVKKRQKIAFAHAEVTHTVSEVGVLTPQMMPVECLRAGQVGYVCVNVKDIRKFRVGDTVFGVQDAANSPPFEGFQPSKPMVFAGVFAACIEEAEQLETAVQRYLLTDPAVHAKRERSDTLGAGYRCGFLGLLHLDVFKQRLMEEYKMEVLVTSPTVPYQVTKQNGDTFMVECAQDFPQAPPPAKTEEPLVLATIMVPEEMVSEVQRLCFERRGEAKSVEIFDNKRMLFTVELPFAEILTDFFDRLQSISHGYATFDYEPCGMKEADIVKVNTRLNAAQCESLSFLCVRQDADKYAKLFCAKLRKMIPPQQFDINISAVIGSKVVCKEKISALRRDVVAAKILCHGHSGDPMRKKKLLDKQKEGKKRLMAISNVQVPAEAFVEMMKL